MDRSTAPHDRSRSTTVTPRSDARPDRHRDAHGGSAKHRTEGRGGDGHGGRGGGAEDGDGAGRKTWLIPLAVIAGFVLLYFVYEPFRQFADEAYAVLSSGDRERTREWVDGFGAWGPAAVLALMVAQTVIPVIPSVLLMVVTVLAFGPVWGGVLTFAGLLLAAAVAFGIGRAVGPATVGKLIGAATERKIEGFVDRYGAGAIVIARISPVVSTDAVSFVAGLVCMGFWRFMLATAAGTLPLTVLVAWLGQGIDRLQTGLIVVSVVSLIGFGAYVYWDRRRRGAGSAG